jgi:hypothetical protein
LAPMPRGSDSQAGTDSTADTDTAVGSDTGGGDDWTWPEPLEPVTITPHESWRTSLTLPYDGFLRYQEGPGGGTWVKFAILNRDPTKVYFQNSWTYPLHQPFATAHLDPFVGLTPAQFDALTLHEAGQQAVLGALLVTPKTGGTEYALQLVRKDPYPKAQVAAIFALVAKALETGGKSWTQLYFPTWQQQAAATADAAWLAQRGIEVSSPARWATGTQCYAGGWTIGRLVQLPGTALESAYANGTLLPSDIVLTDQVPAEVPPVRGIVASQPGTANSHVAVLAQNLGMPYVWLATPAEVADVQALVGQDILLRVVPPDNGWGQCQVRWWPASQLTPAVQTLLTDLKVPQPLVIEPMQTAGAVVLPAADLTPTNLALVGGKAAHYGVLEAAIGSHVRPAKALSFDLWNHFLDQPLPAGAGPDAGKTLRVAIAAKLAPFGPQPNVAAGGVVAVGCLCLAGHYHSASAGVD